MEENKKLNENQTDGAAALYKTIDNELCELKIQAECFSSLLEVAHFGLETYAETENYIGIVDDVFFSLRNYAKLQAENAVKLYEKAHERYRSLKPS